jgi:hypothetical protein
MIIYNQLLFLCRIYEVDIIFTFIDLLQSYLQQAQDLVINESILLQTLGEHNFTA